MLAPRWMKLLRDMAAAQGRYLTMVIAIAIGTATVTAILSAYTILDREVSGNYLGTHPASAQLDLDEIDDALLSQVRLRPDIAEAEASSTFVARAEVTPGEWLPLMLFVVPDFSALQINTFHAQAGAWPPPTDTMLLERTALPLSHADLGGTVSVDTPDGKHHDLQITGLVHDPGLAPAWQEQTIYGYITPATLALLTPQPQLHLLKIIVRQNANNARAIETTARELAQWLVATGHPVHAIRIPPPQLHPHQAQMRAALTLLLMFSLLALVLAAVLTATLVGSLLAQQIRQIAIMKAVGARSRQIFGLYLALIAAVATVSTLIGLPLGLAAGRGFVSVVAELLNLELTSRAVPPWLPMSVVALGELIPLFTALPPIFIAARRTVRSAIDDHGVDQQSAASAAIERLLLRLRSPQVTLDLAIRNSFRRRGRLLLTLSLLATAGALFISCIDLQQAWEHNLLAAAAQRHYQLEVRLQSPAPAAQVITQLQAIPGVRRVESWNSSAAALDHGDAVEIVHTYPDGGHGGMTLRVTSADTTLVTHELEQGRWLQVQDHDAVVLNTTARNLAFRNVQIGDWITLRADNHTLRLQVVGTIRELLTPATIYTTAAAVAEAGPGIEMTTTMTNTVRIALDDPAASASLEPLVIRALTQAGYGIKTVITEQHFGAAQAGHLYILIFALGTIAGLMAVVGLLGLASTLGTSVAERTREFGVMRAIGARSRDVLSIVLSEGLFIGLLSGCAALPLSTPLSLVVSAVINSISQQPLQLNLSFSANGWWLALVLIGATIASLIPASQASRLTIQKTFNY